MGGEISAGSGGESTLGLQTRAGDEGRFRTGEIGNHAGDLVALSIALEGGVNVSRSADTALDPQRLARAPGGVARSEEYGDSRDV